MNFMCSEQITSAKMPTTLSIPVMKSRFNFLAYSVVLAITFAFTSLCYADGAPWVEIKSPHFSVVTDAGEKRGREVATRFEQMRAVYAALMVKAKVNIPIPLQIVAFRNTKEFRQFAPLWHGKPTQLAGLFQPGKTAASSCWTCQSLIRGRWYSMSMRTSS